MKIRINISTKITRYDNKLQQLNTHRIKTTIQIKRIIFQKKKKQLPFYDKYFAIGKNDVYNGNLRITPH